MDTLHVLAVLQIGLPDVKTFSYSAEGYRVPNHRHKGLGPGQCSVQKLGIWQEAKVTSVPFALLIRVIIVVNQAASPHSRNKQCSKLFSYKTEFKSLLFMAIIVFKKALFFDNKTTKFLPWTLLTLSTVTFFSSGCFFLRDFLINSTC